MEPEQIDHKDHPGEYRQQVRSNVFKRVGAQGSPLNSREELVGDWNVQIIGMPGQISAEWVYRFQQNGHAMVERSAQPASTGDEWRFNEGKSFSLLIWCDAMPEYGLPEPTHEEIRMHAAMLRDGRIALWNGDGSMLELLTRQSN